MSSEHPIFELLCEYELAEAYKGDRGSDQMNITLEGFARHVEQRLGAVALAELYQPWEHIASIMPSMLESKMID